MNALDEKQAFRAAAEDMFRLSAGQYGTVFRNTFESFSKLAGRLQSTLTSHTTPYQKNTGAASLLEFQKGVRGWLSSFDDIRNQISGDTFPEKLETACSRILEKLSGEIKFEVPDTTWAPKSGDSSPVSARKRFARTAHAANRSTLKLRNSAARLLRKNPAKQAVIYRTFDQDAFVRYSVTNPIIKLYPDKIQIVIKSGVDALTALHEKSNALNRISATADNDAENPSQETTPAGIIESYTSFLSDLLQTIESAFVESNTAFSAALDDILGDFEKKWETAGTSLLPERAFSTEKNTNSARRYIALLQKKAARWGKYVLCEEEDWRADADLSVLQYESEIIRDDTIRSIRDGIAEHISPVLEETGRIVGEYHETFRTETALSPHDLADHIIREKESLLTRLREITLSQLMNKILQVNIVSSYQRYLSRIKASITSLSDEHSIFETRDTRHIPPVSKVSTVALKELLLTEVFNPLAKQHTVSGQELEGKLREAMRAIAEIDQIVEYNMNAALSLLEEQPEENSRVQAVKLITDGLERTQNQIHELITTFDEIAVKADSGTKKITSTFRSGIQEMADNDKVLELKIKLARAKTREAVRENIRVALFNTRRFIRSALPRAKEYAKKVQKSYNRLLKISGLAPISTLMDVKLSELLRGYHTMSAHLPYVYQKLFGVEPLTDARFFSSRDDEMSQFKEMFSLWMGGQPASIALIGERGSGKTTLMYFVQKEIFQDTPLVTINLNDTIFKENDLLETLKKTFEIPDVQSIDELEDLLMNRDERVICVPENLHNLFLRTVTGFNAVERFLLFVQRTGKSVFWVVTCALYGWQYLDKVLQAGSYFSRTVELRMGEKTQIEDTIIKRHRVSGYILRFDASPEDLKSKSYKKLRTEEERQKYLHERFFGQLSRLASGNIRVAILFWLMSIKEVTNDTMILSPGIEFEHAFVYQLPSGELFSLAAIIQHEHLNAYMHSLVFNQDVKESQVVLNKMLHKGYLQQKNDQFFIHPFLYRPVVKALKSKNILQ